MSARGWRPTSEVWGDDVELRSADERAPIQVWLLGARTKADCPGFVRIERGKRSDAGRLWAVVSGVECRSESEGGAKQLPTFQVAAGDDWIVLGAGFWLGSAASSDLDLVVPRLFEVFDEMSTRMRTEGASAWDSFCPGSSPFDPSSEARMAPPPRFALPLGGGLTGLSIAGTVAAFLVDPGLGATVALQVGLPGVLSGLVSFWYYFGRRVAPRACDRLLRKLRASAVFDQLEPVRAVVPLRPVVILDGEAGRQLGTAVFRAGVFGARSSAYGVRLEISLQTLASPGTVLQTCSIVPASWAAVEVTASQPILARLPSIGREVRSGGRVLWLLEQREIDEGAIEEVLTALTIAAEGAQSGPYR